MTKAYIPTSVDLRAILKRCPQHANCNLVIRNSKKNSLYTGLYCKNHSTHLYWLNDYQIGYLVRLGVENSSGITPRYWDEQTQGRLLNPSFEIRDNDKPTYQGYYMQDNQRIQDRWDY